MSVLVTAIVKLLLNCKRIPQTAASVPSLALEQDLGWKQPLTANLCVVGFQSRMQDVTCIKAAGKWERSQQINILRCK